MDRLEVGVFGIQRKRTVYFPRFPRPLRALRLRRQVSHRPEVKSKSFHPSTVCALHRRYRAQCSAKSVKQAPTKQTAMRDTRMCQPRPNGCWSFSDITNAALSVESKQ